MGQTEILRKAIWNLNDGNRREIAHELAALIDEQLARLETERGLLNGTDLLENLPLAVERALMLLAVEAPVFSL